MCGLSMTALFGISGCSDQQKRQWRFRSAEENYQAALDAEHPDARREGITRIAESYYVDSPRAFEVLDTVARHDPNTQNRCIAIRAFSRYRDHRPVGTLLTILQARPGSEEALPANDEVRWEVARSLLDLKRKGVLNDEQAILACELYLRMLETRPTRDVRLVSLEALGYFKDPKVFTPLINALRGEKDFAVAYQAERSLVALTGVSQAYDPEAWEEWLANTDDPFAKAGQIPPGMRPGGASWWDQQQRLWRKALKLGEGN
ncbi:MAG: hypothetical protein GXY44_06110 [Phycisphaerales bacterium]|nr:hypothetical protein [Phycisphaerales bacterium]